MDKTSQQALPACIQGCMHAYCVYRNLYVYTYALTLAKVQSHQDIEPYAPRHVAVFIDFVVRTYAARHILYEQAPGLHNVLSEIPPAFNYILPACLSLSSVLALSCFLGTQTPGAGGIVGYGCWQLPSPNTVFPQHRQGSTHPMTSRNHRC